MPTRALTALLILPLMAGLLQFGPFNGSTQLTAGPTSTIHADVLVALQTEAQVGVIISLKGPEISLEEATLNELIDNAAARQAAVLADLGQDDFTLGYQYSSVAALVGALTPSGVQELADHPDVAAVHLNEEIAPLLAESVPHIRADEVHGLGVTGMDIDVAVFDTGIDSNHLDLVGSLVQEHCFVFDLDGPRPDLCPGLPAHPAEDGEGHGTHVSGIVASDGDNGIASVGVAPGVRVHAYKVLTDGGWLNGTWAGVVAGLDDIRVNHSLEIEFINFSIGSVGRYYLAGECEPPENPAEYPFAPSMLDAILTLRSEGTITFAASGNDLYRDRMPFPACIQDVIAVGAVRDDDKVWLMSQASDDIDLLAPGISITSTARGGGTTSGNGTSFAAPHAVGVAALLLQARPDLNPTAPGLLATERLSRVVQIELRLKATGTLIKDDLDPANVRWIGRVDARVALLGDDNGDWDGDGCRNGKEYGDDYTTSGERNPLNPYDFYDTGNGGDITGVFSPPFVGDGIIDQPNDVLGVILNYTGNPGYAPGEAAVTGTPGIKAAYDRAPPTGPNVWNSTGRDGVIDLPNDILSVILQYTGNNGCG